ncbi:hypothetical protein [Rickettsia endosymbiont of Urophora cardui]|uniref:hypothetical protein n=1 Tax=Rickettsia endosymbiont of Urophora cardui TaxID=3066265 RepID=UPI00313ADAD5
MIISGLINYRTFPFFRFKTSFGSKFLSRHDQNMTKEMSIKCHLLNKMFEIGKPISVPVG